MENIKTCSRVSAENGQQTSLSVCRLQWPGRAWRCMRLSSCWGGRWRRLFGGSVRRRRRPRLLRYSKINVTIHYRIICSDFINIANQNWLKELNLNKYFQMNIYHGTSYFLLCSNCIYHTAYFILFLFFLYVHVNSIVTNKPYLNQRKDQTKPNKIWPYFCFKKKENLKSCATSVQIRTCCGLGDVKAAVPACLPICRHGRGVPLLAWRGLHGRHPGRPPGQRQALLYPQVLAWL